MNCCICGPVKNCAPYLNKIFENIEKISKLFDDYKIVVFYDKSRDNTLQILKKYQKKNSKFYLYVNKNPTSEFRTHNIAFARNFCLDYVKKNKSTYPFFIMMDFDDVNCKNINVNILKNGLQREDWDALSFNSTPKYYDIWGLSIWPYCFSYNHFENNELFYTIIQDYVTELLQKLPPDELLPCISSFNGFSIYRTNKFLNCCYDGTVRVDLIPEQNLQLHMNAAKSKITYKKYVTVDGRYEDCEHRAFHIQARQQNNARIMISPKILFY